jgi:hypothetical protein
MQTLSVIYQRAPIDPYDLRTCNKKIDSLVCSYAYSRTRVQEQEHIQVYMQKILLEFHWHC